MFACVRVGRQLNEQDSALHVVSQFCLSFRLWREAGIVAMRSNLAELRVRLDTIPKDEEDLPNVGQV